MKATELRIGNLVSAYVYGGKGKSEWMILEGEVHTVGKDIIKLGDGITVPLDDLREIQLSEEKLLKFGFQLDPERQSWYHITYVIGNFEIEVHLSLEYLYNNVPLYYVHQLQNLYFAICGEELTIKEPEA